MYGRVEEMRRRIIAHSDEEIENLKQQVITLANEEAKQIVDSTKAEAEAESEQIGEVGRANLANIRKNIKASFDATVDRSEEHTSELQSRQYLVCRLLLEKKKKK